MVQTLEGIPDFMRIVRLPGIHHDANAVLLMDSKEAILIDSGTAWYQLLQQERIVGQLGEDLTLREIVSPRDAIRLVEECLDFRAL